MKRDRETTTTQLHKQTHYRTHARTRAHTRRRDADDKRSAKMTRLHNHTYAYTKVPLKKPRWQYRDDEQQPIGRKYTITTHTHAHTHAVKTNEIAVSMCASAPM